MSCKITEIFFKNLGLNHENPPTEKNLAILNEEFPPLPGSEPLADQTKQNSHETTDSETTDDSITSEPDPVELTEKIDAGIVSTPTQVSVGWMHNAPKGLLNDGFGMLGLLKAARISKICPSIGLLSSGFDLLTLNVDMNSKEPAITTFAGPLAEGRAQVEELPHHVPDYYKISEVERYFENKHETVNTEQFYNLGEHLKKPIKTQKFDEGLLFYLFYTFPGDFLQIQAANELYRREWRYHMELKVWISRIPGHLPIEKGVNYERGTYFYYDPLTCSKIAKEFLLEYHKMEQKRSSLMPILNVRDG